MMSSAASRYFRGAADIEGEVVGDLVSAADNDNATDEGTVDAADVAVEGTVGGGWLAVQLTKAPAAANDPTSLRSLT